MYKILVIIGSLDIFFRRVQTEASYVGNDLKSHEAYPVIGVSTRQIPYCEHFGICKAIEVIGAILRGFLPFFFTKNAEYDVGQSTIQTRRYYNGYGAPPSNPTYYPAFDPLSVLASIAFLAFLLQSFANLFDRSRSILPTTIAARESAELENFGTAGRILRALEKYENRNRNRNLISNAKDDVA